MSEGLLLALAFVGGVAIGAFFYGGLWWTVRRVPRARFPAGLIVVSLAARLALALPAIFLLSAGSLGRLALCMAGLVIARVAMVRILRPAGNAPCRAAETPGHVGGPLP